MLNNNYIISYWLCTYTGTDHDISKAVDSPDPEGKDSETNTQYIANNIRL